MCYILPPNHANYSSYTRKLDYDLLSLIEKDIIIYKQKGDVCILSDLNACTSNQDDFINNYDSYHLLLFDSYKPDDKIKPR